MRSKKQTFTYVPAKVWIRNFVRSHTFFVPLVGLLLGMLFWCVFGDAGSGLTWILAAILVAVGFYSLFITKRKSCKPNYLLLAKLRFWQVGMLHVFMGYYLFPPKLPSIPVAIKKLNYVDLVVVDPLNHVVMVEDRYFCKCSLDTGIMKRDLYLGMQLEIPSKCVKNYQFSGIPGDVNWPMVMGSLGYSGIVRLNSKNAIKYLPDKESLWVFEAKFRVLYWCKERLFHHFESEKAGLLWAMLFGDKTYLNQVYIKQFNTGGLMHALAVSGMHISLILGVLFWVFSGFGSRASPSKVSLIFIVVLGWFYAMMAGSGAAIIRAILSASWLWVGKYFFFRKVSALHVWFGTAYVQLLICPYLIFQAGFLLSYLAVLGLLVLYPLLKMIWASSNNWVLNYLGDTMALNVSATLFTLPLILGLFHTFPLWFLLGNLILLPLLSGLVYLSIMSLLLIDFGCLGDLVVGVTQLLLQMMDNVLGLLECLPLPFIMGYDWDGFTLLLLFVWLVILCLWVWTILDPTRRWPWRLKHGFGFSLTIIGLLIVILLVEVKANFRAKAEVDFQTEIAGFNVKGKKYMDTLTFELQARNEYDDKLYYWQQERVNHRIEKLKVALLDKSEVFRRRYGVKVVVFSNVL